MDEELDDRFFSGHPIGTYDRIIWRNVLTHILRWPSDRVDGELAELDRLIGETGGFHHHETALWYVSHLMIPEDIRRRLPAWEVNRLGHSLDSVVFPNGEPFCSPEEAEAFDWLAAKRRVDAYWDRFRKNLID